MNNFVLTGKAKAVFRVLELAAKREQEAKGIRIVRIVKKGYHHDQRD